MFDQFFLTHTREDPLIGNSYEKPEIDYLGRLMANARNFDGVTKVIDEGECCGKGAASASIYYERDRVVVEHDHRRILLLTGEPEAVVEQVKLFWRKQRGPSIRCKGEYKH